MTVREAAVAGTFYPGSPDELGRTVDALLAAAPEACGCRPDGRQPKALIVPHAGYVYSGLTAAAAFSRITRPVERVVLVGPAHRVWVDRVVAPGASAMRTPLGDLAIDADAVRDVPVDARAHAREHSLEVELPFVQRVAPDARVVPLLVSEAADDVAAWLDALWGGPETLLVISTDLSHYHPYAEARSRDTRTAAKILALDPHLSGDEACGCAALAGLLQVAARRAMRCELVDLRSSGDTAGDRDEVVGYGAFALYE